MRVAKVQQFKQENYTNNNKLLYSIIIKTTITSADKINNRSLSCNFKTYRLRTISLFSEIKRMQNNLREHEKLYI